MGNGLVGRPKGSLGGERKVKGWQPKKWKVDHEACVMMHINGKSNKEIAEILGKHEIWASLVINSDRAKKVIEETRKRLYEKGTGDVVERYGRILDRAIVRMADYLDNDELAKATPGAVFDRAARAADFIEKRLGNVRDLGNNLSGNVNNGVVNNTTIFATEESVGRLLDALDKSDQVTEIHRKPAMLKVVND